MTARQHDFQGEFRPNKISAVDMLPENLTFKIGYKHVGVNEPDIAIVFKLVS
jgi:alpha-D-ribose 1-methylphosphonate 5-triphosphate synthase subunit PhnI